MGVMRAYLPSCVCVCVRVQVCVSAGDQVSLSNRSSVTLKQIVLTTVHACLCVFIKAQVLAWHRFFVSQDILVEKEFSSARSHHSYRE